MGAGCRIGAWWTMGAATTTPGAGAAAAIAIKQDKTNYIIVEYIIYILKYLLLI